VPDFQRNDDYQEVADRIIQFYKAFPDGRLTSETRFEVLPVPRAVPLVGAKKEKVGDKWRLPTIQAEQQVVVVCVARAYRTPDDPKPCEGTATEPYPGLTPYTEDSEAMNAETSAWGRAIVATGCTKAKKTASANEVRNRRSRSDDDAAPPSDRNGSPAPSRGSDGPQESRQNAYAAAIHTFASKLELPEVAMRAAIASVTGNPSASSVTRENNAAVRAALEAAAHQTSNAERRA